jgi:hypothetical protein
MSQRQELITCKPLLDWLQAASMGSELPNHTIGGPLLARTLCSPPADELLLAPRLQVLHQALPGLTVPPPALETALSHMATALIAQTNDARLVRKQREATQAEPKLPSKKFGVTLPVLMDYLKVTNERQLPAIWHKWANCAEKQDFQVLREELEAYARSLNMFAATVPIVTARTVQDLLSFSFICDSMDDLKLGLHPFIITDGNAEHRQTNRKVARLYGYLLLGDTSVSLADLEILQSKYRVRKCTQYL